MRDMTTGSPLKQILSFFFPLLVGTLFQQFYNIADSVIVGRLLGVNAFAGVGSTASLNFFVLGFAMGCCSGFAIPIAQSFGAGDMEAVRRRIGQTVWLALLVVLAITSLTFFYTDDLLRITNTPEEIFDDAYTYIFIVFMGTASMGLYNLSAAVLRALGDSRTPLYFLIVAVLLNVALDYLFIASFHMGVEGAALATVLSQLLSGVACVIYSYYKLPQLRLHRRDFKPHWREMGHIAYIGIPMGLQSSIIAIGAIILQSDTNALGTAAVAGISAGQKVQNIVTSPMFAVGTTMATYTGQNLGAAKPQRIRQGVRQISLASFFYCLAALAFVYFLGDAIAHLFIGEADPLVFENTQTFLLINGILYPFLVLVFILRNTIQGLGFSNAALLAGAAELVTRLVASRTIVRTYGFIAVVIAPTIAWVVADLVLFPLYILMMRKTERRLQAMGEQL